MVRAPRTVILVAIVAALLAGGTVSSKESAEAAAGKVLEKVAKTWIDLGTFLKTGGHKKAAEEAVEAARAAQADAEGLQTLAEAVTALPEDVPPTAEAERRRAQAAKDVAKLHDKIADLLDGGDVRVQAIRGEHLVRAVQLDPAKPRVAKLAEELKKASVLLRVPGHPLCAWVSLPGGWKPGKETPVLVTCEGAGANYKGNAEGFRGARGPRDVILVTPCALSATNALKPEVFPFYDPKVLTDHEAQGSRIEWDREGLLRVLDFVHDTLGGAEKVAITGFSGGGMLCYGTTLKVPERVLLCAPACPNFSQGMDAGAPEVKDGGPMVRIFTGEKDEHREQVFGQRPGIEGQTDWAVAAFERLGYKDVKRTMLPGVGHSSCVAQVWGAVDEVLAKAKGKGK